MVTSYKNNCRRWSSLLFTLLFLITLLHVTFAQNQQQTQQTQRCPLTRERKPWKDLTCQEQQDFFDSLERLKASGIYDDFVRVHIEADAAAHGTPEFLPWHRYFVWEFETALQSVSNNPCTTLPYWDWELDARRGVRSSVIQDFSRYTGTNPNNGNCQWRATNGGCLNRDFDGSVRLHSQARLTSLLFRFNQYADDFPFDENRNNGFRAELEGGAHAAPHNMIGGHMIDQNSPNDPLFFLHHANVDRIWANWQDLRGMTEVNNPTVPLHYEGNRLNAPMSFAGSGRWNFGSPSPRDVLSNSGSLLRVRYIQDRWVPNHVPDRRWFSTRPRFNNGCGRRRLEPIDEENDNMFAYNSSTADTDTSIITTSTSSNKRQSFLRKKQREQLPIFREFQQSQEPQLDQDNDEDSSLCQRLNTFQDPQEHSLWDLLCTEYMADHSDSTMIDSLIQHVSTQMAIEECKAMDNPKSARSDGDWIENMGMSNERVTFECFHEPDEIDDGEGGREQDR